MNDPRFLKNLAGRSGVFIAAAMAGALAGGGVTYVGSDGGLKTDTGMAFNDSTDTLTVGTGTDAIEITDGLIATDGNTVMAFGQNSTSRVQIQGSTLNPTTTNALDLGILGNIWRDIALGGEVDFTEESDPSAPGANRGALYAKDIDARTYHVARYPTGNVQIVSGEPSSIQTTDATVTTCLTVAIPTNSVMHVEVMGTAYQSAGGNAAGYMTGATYKNLAGVVTLIGAVSAAMVHESNAAWDFAPSISGTNVLFRVTGAAATTIDWDCVITEQLVSP